jgi:pimeloyl-ACP methyl ester carboxylesterase
MTTTSRLEAKPIEHRIDAGAVHLGALEYGDPEAPVVLTLHGLADSAWSLDRLARSLEDRYRVISLDLRGHGRSDWGAYTLLHFVGDLVGICERLELTKPALVGHSLGGQAVAQFCGIYPELPRAAVLIEALGSPPRTRERTDPEGYERSWSRQRSELIRRPARHRPYESLDAAISRFQEAHPRTDRELAAFVVEKNTQEQADDTRIWRHDPEVRDWLAGQDHMRSEQRWRGVSCPVRVILGADSWETFWSKSIMNAPDLEGPMSPEEIARRVGKFADASVVEIPEAGHMIHYDQPDVLNSMVGSFLDETLASHGTVSEFSAGTPG